jgi:hypothetical protein
MKIVPTVGRVVWFYENGKTQLDAGEQPNAAMVAYVHGDGRLINIGYFDHNGLPRQSTSVRLMQEGETDFPAYSFCTWMPYQVGQAKKHADERAKAEG